LIAGLYKGLYQPATLWNGLPRGWRLPAYIPSRSFALALMDVVLPGTTGRSGAAGAVTPPVTPAAGVQPDVPQSLQDLRMAVANVPNAQVRDALLPLIDAAGHDITKVRENIEGWFDSAMDGVSGWYKRKTQWILLGLAVVAALALKVDTFVLANFLLNNPSAREAIVSRASQQTKLTSPELDESLAKLAELQLPIGWSAEQFQAIIHADLLFCFAFPAA